MEKEQDQDKGCSRDCNNCNDPDCEGVIDPDKMSIGMMIEKSEGPGGPVLAPTPYYKRGRRLQ